MVNTKVDDALRIFVAGKVDARRCVKFQCVSSYKSLVLHVAVTMSTSAAN